MTIDTTDPSLAADCDCPGPGSGFSRRGFLGGAAGLAALGMVSGFGPLGNTSLAFAADGSYTGDVLVVISFRGGMDGLSAVGPVGDSVYQGWRPSTAVTPAQALPLAGTSLFGMHPALAPLQNLYSSGQLAFVHDVGQPDPTMSHFDAMALMEQATPGSSALTGWIDRMSTRTPKTGETPFAELSVGPSTAPEALLGTFPSTAMQSLRSFSLNGSNPSNLANWHSALAGLQSGGTELVRAPALNTLAALAQTEALSGGSYSPSGGAQYPPNTDIGNSLSNVAQLIKANVGVRVAAIDSNNWDMHVGMGTPGSGWMHDNLTYVGKALAAFATDLGSAMSGVTVVTLSEFGRRVLENNSNGLDHGHGNLMYVLGGGINGGKVYAPSEWTNQAPGAASSYMRSSNLPYGNLPGKIDYRAVLAQVLTDRCGFSQSDVSAVFPKLSSTTPAALVGLTKPLT